MPSTLSLLERVILPEIGQQTLRQTTPAAVADWYESLPRNKPTQRAHAYSLLWTVLGQAVEEGHLSDNPCKVRGAGKSSRARVINIATPAQLVAIADGMPRDTGDMVEAAYAAWRADQQAGRSRLLLAATRDTVRDLNQRARQDRLAVTGQPPGREAALALTAPAPVPVTPS